MSAPPFPSKSQANIQENLSNPTSTTTNAQHTGNESWRTADHAVLGATTADVPPPIPGQPPTPVELGNSGWNILHSAAAVYPYQPTDEQKDAMQQFIHGWSFTYACNWCAYHMRVYLKENPPLVENKHEVTQYMCRFHNRVNEHLKKPQYDCDDIDSLMKRWHPGYPDRMEDKPSWESRIDAELAKMKQAAQVPETNSVPPPAAVAPSERGSDFFLLSTKKGEAALAAALGDSYPSSPSLEVEVADPVPVKVVPVPAAAKPQPLFRAAPPPPLPTPTTERRWGESANEVAEAMSQHFHSTFVAADPKGVFGQLSSWWSGAGNAEVHPPTSTAALLSAKADVEKRALEMGEQAVKAVKQFSEFKKPFSTVSDGTPVSVEKSPSPEGAFPLVGGNTIAAPTLPEGAAETKKNWWGWDRSVTDALTTESDEKQNTTRKVDVKQEKIAAVKHELAAAIDAAKAKVAAEQLKDTPGKEVLSAVGGVLTAVEDVLNHSDVVPQATWWGWRWTGENSATIVTPSEKKKDEAKGATPISNETIVELPMSEHKIKDITSALTEVKKQVAAEQLKDTPGKEVLSAVDKVLTTVEDVLHNSDVVPQATWWGWWWADRDSVGAKFARKKKDVTEKEIELLQKKEEMAKAAAQYSNEAIVESHKGEEKIKEHTKAYNKAADRYREAARQNLEKLAEKAEEALDVEQGVAVKKNLVKAAEAVKDFSEEQRQQLQQYGEEYYKKSREYRQSARKHLDDLVTQAQTYAAKHKEAMSEHSKMYAKAAEQYEEAGRRHAAALLESSNSSISEKVKMAEAYRAEAKKNLEKLGEQAKSYADEHHLKLTQHQEAFSKAAEQYREASRLRALQVAEKTKSILDADEETLQRAKEIADKAQNFYQKHHEHIAARTEAYEKAANDFLNAAKIHMSDLASQRTESAAEKMRKIDATVEASAHAMKGHSVDEVQRIQKAVDAVSAHVPSGSSNSPSTSEAQKNANEMDMMEIMKKLNDCDIYCPEKDLLDASPLFKKKI